MAAPATPSRGCKGVTNAQDKDANGKGLAAVADRLGCNPAPPADPMACPAGQNELSRWIWDGSAFVATSTSTAPNPFGDPGGFWTENGTPVTIVIRSTTDEIKSIDYAALVAENSGSVSQNQFVNRTGIAEIRYCG